MLINVLMPKVLLNHQRYLTHHADYAYIKTHGSESRGQEEVGRTR